MIVEFINGFEVFFLLFDCHFFLVAIFEMHDTINFLLGCQRAKVLLAVLTTTMHHRFFKSDRLVRDQN
jgi:hypothetical protein